MSFSCNLYEACLVKYVNNVDLHGHIVEATLYTLVAYFGIQTPKKMSLTTQEFYKFSFSRTFRK